MAELMPPLQQKFTDLNDNPLAGGFVHTYIAGTTTPAVTYTDSTEATPNANPIVLNSDGAADIWLPSGLFKFVIQDLNGALVKTVDQVRSTAPSTLGSDAYAALAAASEAAAAESEAAAVAAQNSALAAQTAATASATAASDALVTIAADEAATLSYKNAAATSETNAASSASAAASSATSAATSATNAAASASAAASSAASINPSSLLAVANNLSDVASASTSRTNLGLGSLATKSVASLTTDVSGTLPIGNGGTGQTTQQASMDALAGTQSAGKYLRSDGTHTTLTTIQAADIPTLNQNTTGTAASATNFSGSLSGDVTGTQSSTAIAAATVTGKVLTGFTSGAGTVGATDSILQAIQKLNGNDALKAPIASPTFTGTVTAPALTLSSTPLAIGSGGTGQTTKATAFDALQPMTTSGDIIYGGASGTGTRLAKGSDGQFLTLSSGLPAWAAVSVTNTTVSKSANYTLTGSDYLVVVTAASAQTLPTAVGVSGKIYAIVNSGSSLFNVTINTTSAQTIGGRASGDIILAKPGDYLLIMSDGTNWQVLAKQETKTLSATSSAFNFSSYSGAGWPAMTGNSITLTAGAWRVGGYAIVYTGGTGAIGYISNLGFFAANGAGTGTTPAALSGTIGPTSWAIDAFAGQIAGGTTNSLYTSSTLDFDISVSSSTTVYLVPQLLQAAGSSGSSTVMLWAKRVF